ncbi:hypothetical protein [Bordetella genomosp. 4]|uniref:Uncharacterized protein n=1 Tax=Bordetella genomosp. 4 TaxID=463044 RepID=A0A261U5K9_9BORD|nr:hypothetical protein [Bordetella genomosp. 4]OZI56767.1 hypothetical protein CAL20_15315 [Bordetella genomosp. 4]
MDYPGEFKVKADIQAASRHRQWASEATADASVPTVSDEKTAHCMVAHGGGFIKSLARTWQLADPNNRDRLKAAFAPEFVRYAQLAESFGEA